MSSCVVRFGGNSLSIHSVMEAFATQLTKADENQIIVVSAIPEIQKEIEFGLELLTNSSSGSEQIINRIKVIISEKLSVFHQSEAGERLNSEISILQNLLKGIELTGDYSLSLKDQVVSFSEKITSVVLQQFLVKKGINSTLALPENLGLLVTEEYGNATVLFEQSAKLKEYLTKGISLIPGSYGVTLDGKIARLGARSADYSAAAITRLCGVASLQLWELDKEFRTADAEYISGAKLISRLTYSEASELSYFSHLSIHPRIVEPLIDNHIPIHIYRLTESGKELSTVINSKSFVIPNVVKSVVHTDEIAVLKLNGPGVGFKPGILAKVTTAFHQSAINIRSVITAQVSINIILNKNEIEKALSICRQLNLTSVSDIVVENNVSLIAVVGHGMQQHHGVSAKLFSPSTKSMCC